jgi:succinyl-CoA synthetase beta subunit
MFKLYPKNIFVNIRMVLFMVLWEKIYNLEKKNIEWTDKVTKSSKVAGKRGKDGNMNFTQAHSSNTSRASLSLKFS